MVVAVVTVRMMQVTVDKIINVIAVRHRFVAAAGSVDVTRLVAAAVRRTLIRIGCAHFELMFVHMITVRVMQVTVVQIVDVIVMPDRRVAACRTVLMIVMGMMWFVTGAHGDSPEGVSRVFFSGVGPMAENAFEQRAQIPGEDTRLVVGSPTMPYAISSDAGKRVRSRIVRLNQSRRAASAPCPASAAPSNAGASRLASNIAPVIQMADGYCY
ncbi:hypothetical protein [Paraburkholderia sp. RAU2J]|uniref:hypothetical protein n=1 Tax=Paraburkholderia sp. RAU2J TaxID=1938810 RepID=UPI0018F5DE1F|nr:hypothetical protein [Paraburkholderia sp. RAU2J]